VSKPHGYAILVAKFSKFSSPLFFNSQVYTLHELSRHTSMMGLISTLGQELIALVIDDFGGNTFRQRRFA
jgi:uncharacterized membrane protein YdcZ (DUF606 family)